MKKGYDATLPIKHLAKQIETAMTVAGNANQLYTAAQQYMLTTLRNILPPECDMGQMQYNNNKETSQRCWSISQMQRFWIKHH
eukprot:15364446-Ditylum_brightwellii.AAC.1